GVRWSRRPPSPSGGKIPKPTPLNPPPRIVILPHRGPTRMVRILPLLLLPLMFSCSASKGATQPRAPSSQETYEYGTCPKARDDCPRERTLACALQIVASRYNACSKREDCVAANVDAKCSDSGSCPPLSVNREM